MGRPRDIFVVAVLDVNQGTLMQRLPAIYVNSGANVAASADGSESVPCGVGIDEAARLPIWWHRAVVCVSAGLPSGWLVPLKSLYAGCFLHANCAWVKLRFRDKHQIVIKYNV